MIPVAKRKTGRWRHNWNWWMQENAEGETSLYSVCLSLCHKDHERVIDGRLNFLSHSTIATGLQSSFLILTSFSSREYSIHLSQLEETNEKDWWIIFTISPEKEKRLDYLVNTFFSWEVNERQLNDRSFWLRKKVLSREEKAHLHLKTLERNDKGNLISYAFTLSFSHSLSFPSQRKSFSDDRTIIR